MLNVTPVLPVSGDNEVASLGQVVLKVSKLKDVILRFDLEIWLSEKTIEKKRFTV